MSEPPSAHTFDLDRASNMSFGELRALIDNSLEARTEPGFSADRPRSKQQFLDLIDMLDAKLDKLRETASKPMPPQPTYEGPPYMSPWYEPSGRLNSLYDRRDRLTEHLLHAQYDPSLSRQDVARIERDLRDLDREIELREAGEQEEHERRHADYEKASREARRAYEHSSRLWRKQKEERDEMRRSLAQRENMVRRIREVIERAFKSKAAEPTGHVPFEILPPGEATEERARGYYDGLRRRGKLKEFDQERLDKVLELPWVDWRPGTAGMEGYSIFRFAHTEKVLLECPVYSNAAYVLDSGEDRLLGMSKQELRASGEAKPIFHSGNWIGRVRRALDLPPMSEES